MLLAAFVDEFYAPAHLGIKAKSLDQMRFAVAVYSRWLGHDARLGDLDELTIRQWLSSMVGHVAAVTIAAKRRIILSIWKSAFEEELMDRPPRISKVKPIKVPRSNPIAWTPEEVGRLLAAASKQPGEIAGIAAGLWFSSLFSVAYDTGARKSELLRMRCRDISIDQGWCVIVRQKQGTPRVCQLAPDTIESCRWVWSRDRELMWPWPHTESNFFQRFRTILKRAKLEGGNGHGGAMHKLRRTCATLTEANGGQGHIAIGDTRAVFERHYLDKTKMPSQLSHLPRPVHT